MQMRKSMKCFPRLMPMLTLPVLLLALTGCNASTGLVRADLDSPALAGLKANTLQRCTGIPKRWPEKDLTQAEVERLVVQDRLDSQRCASASISYIRTIESRDRSLTGGTKR